MKYDGFTFTEVLIILCVICLVVGMSTYNMDWSDGIGEKTSDQQTTSALGILVIQYKLHNNGYPASLSDLTKKSSTGYGPYITEIKPDSYGIAFNYRYSDKGFAIWSNGENLQNESGGGVPEKFSGDDVGIISY